ncbi:MAG: bacillithiol system redox-active protein YtxJ [Ferruginibacter sp.]
MDWIELTKESQLVDIKEQSNKKPQLIFKHSTRCAVSGVVKYRLERSSSPGNVDFYFLDLLRNREISNKIAEEFSVFHKSPQVLLIKNGACIYDESHSGINMSDIEEQAAAL